MAKKTRKELLIILALIVIIALLLSSIEFFSKSIEEGEASQFVTEDLREKYPLADISIISIDEKTDDGEKYYSIKAKVTEDYASPCPKRMHIYYNYPEQNFIQQPTEHITTDDCEVCGEGICTIAFPEEAIIASHTIEGTEKVNEFLEKNKYAVPYVSKTDSIWLVRWDSPTASYYYEIEINVNGQIMKEEKKIKE